jgi:putative FmdB family regulatory protein
MPIYEYRCAACGHEWSRQELLSEHENQHPVCPKCGSGGEQVFSAFFVKTVRKS